MGAFHQISVVPAVGAVSAVDVAVGVDYVVAVQHATADHEGRHLDVTGCQLIRMEGGRIAEVRGHYSDQYAFDAFWRPEEDRP